ncbi:hypothetical protein Y032_0072g707 [Ancylostoma ceylanicum]|uniref:Uncharacterized protein n=1 Tax=Ancylostoma ceylanicum TaxID=53326 RepID=A0A016TWK8_9BILA|nr:hypothetical protein Y032_0072g707 [Ancylostoma ceylanicum]
MLVLLEGLMLSTKFYALETWTFEFDSTHTIQCVSMIFMLMFLLRATTSPVIPTQYGSTSHISDDVVPTRSEVP